MFDPDCRVPLTADSVCLLVKCYLRYNYLWLLLFVIFIEAHSTLLSPAWKRTRRSSSPPPPKQRMLRCSLCCLRFSSVHFNSLQLRFLHNNMSHIIVVDIHRHQTVISHSLNVLNRIARHVRFFPLYRLIRPTSFISGLILLTQSKREACALNVLSHLSLGRYLRWLAESQKQCCQAINYKVETLIER